MSEAVEARASLARGTVYGVLTIAIERAAAFAIVLYLARRLGREGFGLWSFIVAGMAPLQVMADQGIEIAAIARMARTPHDVMPTLRAVLVLRTVLCGVAVLAAWWVLPRLSDDPLTRMAAVGGSVGVLLGAAMPVRSVLRAREQMGRLLRVAMGDAVLGGIATVLGTLMGSPVASVLLLRAVASWVVASVVASTGTLGPPTDRSTDVRGLVREAWPLAASVLAITITLRAGHVAVMLGGGAAAVAALGAAARVAEVLGLLADGVMQAVFPRMAARGDGRDAFTATTARWMAVVIGGAVVAMYGAAPALCSVLFGEAYGDAVAPLRILAWGGIFTGTGSVILHGLVVARRTGALLVTNIAACALTLALQFTLVPHWGSVGAACATIGGTAAGQLFLGFAVSTRPWVVHVWRAALPAIAAAAIGTVAAMLAVAHWTIPVGLGVWMVASWTFGAVRAEDARLVRAALPRIPGMR